MQNQYKHGFQSNTDKRNQIKLIFHNIFLVVTYYTFMLLFQDITRQERTSIYDTLCKITLTYAYAKKKQNIKYGQMHSMACRLSGNVISRNPKFLY